MSRSATPRRRGIQSSSWFTATRSSMSRRIARSRGPAVSATTAAPGSWPTAVWPCCPRAQRWAPPTRRSGRGRPRASPPRPASRTVWADTVETIGRPPDRTTFVSVGDRGADIFAHLERVRDAGWDAVVRAARERRLVQGGASLPALRAARAMGASTIRTKTGAAVVCVAWRALELLPPRSSSRGRTPIRVRGVRVWNDRLEWLLLTTRPIESLDQALEIVSWVHPAVDRGGVSQSMENRMPGRRAPAHTSGSAGAAARGAGHRRRPPFDAARCCPARQHRTGGRAGGGPQGPRGQASETGRMLREQPSLSAWGRPAGRFPRPHVRRRAWLANTVEGLVRSHDPGRGLRTRSDHRLSQMKCG